MLPFDVREIHDPYLKQGVIIALIMHLVVFLALFIPWGSHSIDLAPPPSIDISIEGPPQPAMAAPISQPPVQQVLPVKPDQPKPKPEPKPVPPQIKPQIKAPEKLTTPALPDDPEGEIAKPAVKPQLKPKKPVPTPEAPKNLPDRTKPHISPNNAKAPVGAKAQPAVGKINKGNADQGKEVPPAPVVSLDSQDISSATGMIEDAWAIPPGLDYNGITVKIKLKVDQDGKLEGITVINDQPDPSFQASSQSLQRAIREKFPFGLSPEKLVLLSQKTLSFAAPEL